MSQLIGHQIACILQGVLWTLYLFVASFFLHFLALPAIVLSPMESTADYPAGSCISLLCTWNTSVYYVTWYKNGELIHEEDLAAPSILITPPQGITFDSNFTLMTSTLTIDNATLDNSGNYTCAVTCGARGVEFGRIAGNLQDTTEVFVYGKTEYISLHCLAANLHSTRFCSMNLLRNS